jgi:hypothetical protein
MAQAMKGVAGVPCFVSLIAHKKAMKRMNAQMNIPALQAVMREFEMQVNRLR